MHVDVLNLFLEADEIRSIFDLIKRSLKGETFVPASEAFRTLRSRPHGHVEAILKMVQLDLYGEVDDEITHEWIPLYQLDEAGLASVRKTKADEAAVWIESGVIDPDEARSTLADDPDSPYAGLEGPAPEPEPDPSMGGGEGGGGPGAGGGMALPGGAKVGLGK